MDNKQNLILGNPFLKDNKCAILLYSSGSFLKKITSMKGRGLVNSFTATGDNNRLLQTA